MFDILLGGSVPIILALASSIYGKQPIVNSHIDAGQLLAVSQFLKGTSHKTRELALQRNQFVVVNADEVVFARIYEGSMLEELKLCDGQVDRVLN